MTPPIFWLSMIYACDHCGHEETFLLEDGCEGPRDGEPVVMRLPDDHPVSPGESRPWPRTASGRLVVPVPYVAGRCVHCNADGRGHRGQGRFGPVRTGFLTHVRWNEDRELDPRPVGVPGGPHFRYPANPSDPQACGVPVYTGGAS